MGKMSAAQVFSEHPADLPVEEYQAALPHSVLLDNHPLDISAKTRTHQL